VRRLLILDSLDISWLGPAASASASSDSWDLLPIGINGDVFNHRIGASLRELPSCAVVDLSHVTSKAHALVNGFVLELVGRLPGLDLGGETLAGLLDTPDGNHWWWVQTSEKNPIRDPLVGQLYRLALVRLIVESRTYDEIWLHLSEAPLRKAVIGSQRGAVQLRVLPCRDRGPRRRWDRHPLIRYWVHVWANLASFLAIRLLLLVARWPNPDTESGGVFFYTMYPYWWLDPFSEDATERFFSALPDDAPQQFAAWLLWPRLLWKNRQAVRGVVQSRRMIPLQDFVSMPEALSLLSIRRFWKVVRFQWRMRRHLAVEFAGFEVGGLIADDVTRSLTGSEMLRDDLLSHAVRTFSETVRPRALVYRMELQTGENALLFGARRRTETIGFLHSSGVDNFLPLWFEPGELARPVDPNALLGGRPMPDGILVCGGGSIRRLVSYGYPECRIARCGAQRHGRLLVRRSRAEGQLALRGRLNLPKERPVVLVALALIEAETAALFGALTEACIGLPDVMLVIKKHPGKLTQDRAMNDALEELGPDRATLMPAGADVYDYLPAADAMACLGSTIAFDALALGVMPVVFEDRATFAGTSIASYEHSMFIVRDGHELGSALNHILTNSGPFRKRRESWPEVLDKVFGDFDTPLFEQLRNGLEQLGVSLGKSR